MTNMKSASYYMPTRKNNPSTDDAQTTRTSLPRWAKATIARGADIASDGSARKFYVLIGLWVAALTLAVASALRGSRGAEPQPAPGGENAFAPLATNADSLGQRGDADRADEDEDYAYDGTLSVEPPASFRGVGENVIEGDKLLDTPAEIYWRGERPLRILHLGDSHVAGRHFPRGVKEALRQRLDEAGGADEGRGFFFSYIGKNGATNQTFLHGDYMRRIAEARPDLIILSLGTNESFGMGYTADQHSRQLDTFFATLSEAAPDAAVLMTTLPGCYLRARRRGYRPNPMCAPCARLTMDYAAAHGHAAWDLFTLCGGAEAPANWWRAGMMRPDHVHFTPEGYRLMGNLLGEILGAEIEKRN